MIIAALADQGIEANAVGGFTAGFRAEAPGVVEVWVKESDLARSQEAIHETAALTEVETTAAPHDPIRQQKQYRDFLNVLLLFVTPIVLILVAMMLFNL